MSSMSCVMMLWWACGSLLKSCDGEANLVCHFLHFKNSLMLLLSLYLQADEVVTTAMLFSE